MHRNTIPGIGFLIVPCTDTCTSGTSRRACLQPGRMLQMPMYIPNKLDYNTLTQYNILFSFVKHTPSYYVNGSSFK